MTWCSCLHPNWQSRQSVPNINDESGHSTIVLVYIFCVSIHFITFNPTTWFHVLYVKRRDLLDQMSRRDGRDRSENESENGNGFVLYSQNLRVGFCHLSKKPTRRFWSRKSVSNRFRTVFPRRRPARTCINLKDSPASQCRTVASISTGWVNLEKQRVSY